MSHYVMVKDLKIVALGCDYEDCRAAAESTGIDVKTVLGSRCSDSFFEVVSETGNPHVEWFIDPGGVMRLMHETNPRHYPTDQIRIH